MLLVTSPCLVRRPLEIYETEFVVPVPAFFVPLLQMAITTLGIRTCVFLLLCVGLNRKMLNSILFYSRIISITKAF